MAKPVSKKIYITRSPKKQGGVNCYHKNIIPVIAILYNPFL